MMKRNQLIMMNMNYALMLHVVLVLLCSASISFAEPRYDKFGGLVQRGAVERQGYIDFLELSNEHGRVVINDEEYRLADGALLYTRYGSQASLAIYKVGMPVQFYSVQGKITNMWPVDAQSLEDAGQTRPKLEDDPEGKEDRDTIYREGGIWKN